MTTLNIAFSRIAALLRVKIDQNDMTTREAARYIGLTHTTLIRALKGSSMDLPTVLKIAAWLDVQPSTLLDTVTADPTVAYVASLIELNPGLKHLFAQLGSVSPSVAHETLAYMVFRAGLQERIQQ